jgi:hypothetical protein
LQIEEDKIKLQPAVAREMLVIIYNMAFQQGTVSWNGKESLFAAQKYKRMERLASK